MNPSKPTVLKIAHGTYRADRVQPNEPTFEPIPEGTCPEWLSDVGKNEWNRLFPLLKERGLATDADLMLLSEWCRIISKLRYLDSVTKDEDMVQEKKATAGIIDVINPYEKLYDSYFDKMIKLSAKFGLSPADRTKINMPTPLNKEKKKDLIRRASGI